MSVQFPPCPPQYKQLQHYLKVAAEHDQRDPVVSYWCRLYALQTGLKIDKKSEEAMKVLLALMEWLEKQKAAMADNETITNEMAAQAYMENYALKLFLWADGQDRAGNFNKNVVKSFYTSGMIFDVMETFGEIPENIAQNKKYAKWKASYIHNCLKNGETPIPGPQGGFEDEEGAAGGAEFPAQPTMGFVQPPGGFPPNNLDQGPSDVPQNNFSEFNLPSVPAGGFNPHDLPSVPPMNFPSAPGGFPSVPQPTVPSPQTPQPPAVQPQAPYVAPVTTSGGVLLTPEQINKAQKYCKWAGSALNYDDIPTAILNLQKGLTLLQTGQDPA